MIVAGSVIAGAGLLGIVGLMVKTFVGQRNGK